MAICPSCGQENPDVARFCFACATLLAAVPAQREERKIVTILFADLVGFTSRAEQLDPEEVRDLQEPYWRGVRAEIERHGGTVEKFIGDAVMGLFGAPLAHEDDPERAVRAALAIREWAQEQEGLRVRIAVTTGEALVRLGAQPLTGEGMVSGDVVNTAARLQAAAPTNGVLVGGATYEATRQVVEYREHPGVEAKGKIAPVAVWEALEARVPVGVEPIPEALMPLVGRTRERELLVSALARVREERTTQLVTLIGVPGIGKSRLVYELMQAAAAEPNPVRWQRGRSLAYGDGVSFWALAEIVKSQAGIHESDSDNRVREKLAELLRAVVSDEAEAQWVEIHLRPLVGLDRDGDLSDERRSDLFAAWRRLFEALADQRPLVLVFEDLHWADDGLLDFVEELIEWVTDVPLLVVGTARPELLKRRPTWAGGSANAFTISLSPLSDEETARLLGALLERSLLPSETQSTLLAHAGGNPLYAQQFVHMLRERGDSEELPLPTSVQGIIAARLDALSPQEKSLLQEAAVVGKVFWSGALAGLQEIDRTTVEHILHSLQRKEFVQRARRSSVAGESEYTFGHALLRDVAYGQIPRAARIEKHEKAAGWVESLGRSEDHAEILAHHHTTACELACATGRSSDALAVRARTSLVRAADRALALNAFAAAARFYERALELSPTELAERARVLLGHGKARRAADRQGDEALLEASAAFQAAGDREGGAEAEAELGALLWERNQTDEALPHLRRAVELVRDRPASRAKATALISLARVKTFTGKPSEAVELAREALATAEQLDSDALRADALNYIGSADFMLGEIERSIAPLKRSLELALAANALQPALRACHNLYGCLRERGDFSAADEIADQGLRLAERTGNRHWITDWQWRRVTKLFLSGRWDEAADLADSLGRLHPLIAIARGDARELLPQVERQVDEARRSKRPDWLPDALAVYARALLATERDTEAQKIGDELVESLRVPSATSGPLLWSVIAGVLTALGRSDDLLSAVKRAATTPWTEAAAHSGRGQFGAAAEVYAQLGARPQEADARLHAAKILIATGRRGEAEQQLEKALGFYRLVEATHRIAEAEALLVAKG